MGRNRYRQPRGFVRGPRVADKMTPEYLAFADSAMTAERAGDLETALEYHRGVPMFARSSHRMLLTQLVDLAGEMTPWLWARWAAYLTTRAEDRGTRSGQIVRAAQEYVVNMFHAVEWQRMYDEGEDPVPLHARVVGEDWTYHQVCTFELGGLEAFLDDLATGRLAEASALAREWCDARMGGYRLEASGPLDLRVRDLATGEILDLLDLGAATHAREGGWLLGRLVPSGTSPALMFDSRPLPVDERTAYAVAGAEARGGWITALVDAIGDGRLDPDLLTSEDRELVTDVPALALLRAGTRPNALPSALSGLKRGRDEIGRAAFRILRDAADGAWQPPLAAYVAAAVMTPHGFAEAQRVLKAGPDVWEPWARLTPDPARSRLRRLSAPWTSTAA